MLLDVETLTRVCRLHKQSRCKRQRFQATSYWGFTSIWQGTHTVTILHDEQRTVFSSHCPL